MPNVSASGVTVRHAVSRALATANLAPTEATYRVLSARAWPRSDGQVGRAEVFLEVGAPRPLARWEPHELADWVNPDGEHPLMTVVALPDPVFVEITPVTWDRWLGWSDEMLPDDVDPLCPVVHVGHDRALAYAAAIGRRLPTRAEFQALWGAETYPWGDRRDAALGRHEPPRFGHVPEVAEHPPVRGVYDLGAWLWHWLDEPVLAGACVRGKPAFGARDVEGPVGFRCVVDAGAADLQ